MSLIYFTRIPVKYITTRFVLMKTCTHTYAADTSILDAHQDFNEVAFDKNLDTAMNYSPEARKSSQEGSQSM